MPVPKKKRHRSHNRARRAQDKHAPIGWTVVKETGEFVPPHRVSPTGWYKGKKIFKTKAELKQDKTDK